MKSWPQQVCQRAAVLARFFVNSRPAGLFGNTVLLERKRGIAYFNDKAHDVSLRNKRSAFLAETRTRMAAHTTMITTHGLRKNAYQAGIPFEVTLDDLFA